MDACVGLWHCPGGASVRPRHPLPFAGDGQGQAVRGFYGTDASRFPGVSGRRPGETAMSGSLTTRLSRGLPWGGGNAVPCGGNLRGLLTIVPNSQASNIKKYLRISKALDKLLHLVYNCLMNSIFKPCHLAWRGRGAGGGWLAWWGMPMACFTKAAGARPCGLPEGPHFSRALGIIHTAETPAGVKNKTAHCRRGADPSDEIPRRRPPPQCRIPSGCRPGSLCWHRGRRCRRP